MVRNLRFKMAMAGAAALVMTGAFSAPALARAGHDAEVPAIAAGTGDCPSGYACLWVDSNWSGSRFQGQYNNSTLPSFINNLASSSFNNGNNCTAYFFTEAGYQGQRLAEGLGSVRQNLALDGWNDTIESLKWCSPDMCPLTVKATLLVLMAGILSGCGSSQPGGARVPDRLGQSTVDMVTNSGDYPARLYRVALVDVVLTEKCMRDAGIPWKGDVARPNPDADEGGGVSADWVRQHGYGLSEAKPSDRPNVQASDSDVDGCAKPCSGRAPHSPS